MLVVLRSQQSFQSPVWYAYAVEINRHIDCLGCSYLFSRPSYNVHSSLTLPHISHQCIRHGWRLKDDYNSTGLNLRRQLIIVPTRLAKSGTHWKIPVQCPSAFVALLTRTLAIEFQLGHYDPRIRFALLSHCLIGSSFPRVRSQECPHRHRAGFV